MSKEIVTSSHLDVAIIKLNRPDVLNAWNRQMRRDLVAALADAEANQKVRAIVLTGTGVRAFGAGQDLNEAKDFDAARSQTWIAEWEELYGSIRNLSKPIVAALNGVAVGSAFQVALLCDFRVAHAGVKMGQPEINVGIVSTLGPWIMREMIGLARTIDLTLTGRLLDAAECYSIGIINRLVNAESVMEASLGLASELGSKPSVAMKLNKLRLREMSELGFRDAVKAGDRLQPQAYASGEPETMISLFLAGKL